MIDKKREAANGNYQKLHPERIMVSIIGGLKFHVDQVHGGIRASNVDKLKIKERKEKKKKTQRLQDYTKLTEQRYSQTLKGVSSAFLVVCIHYLFTCLCKFMLPGGI